jgi:hypothetical protein
MLSLTYELLLPLLVLHFLPPQLPHFLLPLQLAHHLHSTAAQHPDSLTGTSKEIWIVVPDRISLPTHPTSSIGLVRSEISECPRPQWYVYSGLAESRESSNLKGTSNDDGCFILMVRKMRSCNRGTHFDGALTCKIEHFVTTYGYIYFCYSSWTDMQRQLW